MQTSVSGPILYKDNKLRMGSFRGTIEEVRLWSVERTQKEIIDNMDNAVCGQQSELVVYYKFDQGIAEGNNIGEDTCFDLSTNAQHGILKNFALIDSLSNWVPGNQQLNMVTDSVFLWSCTEALSPSGRYTYRHSGIYYDTVSVDHCDTIVITDFHRGADNNDIYLYEDYLYTTATSGKYQWLDCDNDFAPIAGETNSSFKFEKHGKYAVEVRDYSCIDTSECFGYIGMNQNHKLKANVHIFPNPNNGNFSIDLGAIRSNIQIRLLSVQGQLVLEREVKKEQFIELDLRQPSGIYLLQIIGLDGMFSDKIIIQ